MLTYFLYAIIFAILFIFELLYFRIADRCNIIDKPNQRSSHSAIVLRGGGIIFLFGVLIWTIAVLCGAFSETHQVYPWFLLAVTLAAGISFVDDIHSLPDSVRLVVQFIAMGLMILQLFSAAGDSTFFSGSSLWMKVLFIVAALVVCVGATNIYNFMDGINGITAGYSLAVLLPLILVNARIGFMDQSFLLVALLAVLVFSIFNFRPKGKAKCFAGDVGSVGMAFILLFAIGMLIMKTGDITWLLLLLVYGIDGCLTICHRIMLHEKLGEAHRKHAYQIMANELRMSHPLVSCIYMLLQLAVSLGFIYLTPDTGTAHWIYLGSSLIILSIAYILFMKKYYFLHEQYLASLKND